jgi:S-methylmethionine-dependent homocysteine/selenocysteine methylase
MIDRNQARESLLRTVRVLDGGMASELEYLGADINGPLWSAHVLEASPEKIIAVHRAYIEAGADSSKLPVTRSRAWATLK